MGENKKAKKCLEDAYFEIKSKSKEIKDKDDRRLFMNTVMNKSIMDKWESL